MVECPDERDRMVAVLSAVVASLWGGDYVVLTVKHAQSLREDV